MVFLCSGVWVDVRYHDTNFGGDEVEGRMVGLVWYVWYALAKKEQTSE